MTSRYQPFFSFSKRSFQGKPVIVLPLTYVVAGLTLLQMLKLAGFAVAMGNGSQRVKKVRSLSVFLPHIHEAPPCCVV